MDHGLAVIARQQTNGKGRSNNQVMCFHCSLYINISHILFNVIRNSLSPITVAESRWLFDVLRSAAHRPEYSVGRTAVTVAALDGRRDCERCAEHRWI